MLDFLVIIPTHKRPEPLRAAVESATGQTGITKAIIIADDCASGSAAEVAANFPEVIYLRNPTPSGGWPGQVRNFAFDSSRDLGIQAKYVHFLDDDDTAPEGHYAAVKEAFDRHPGVGVIFGVLRPFCTFSDNPDRRTRQELQLRGVRDHRIYAARFPWLYQRIGKTVRLPGVTRWLFNQHAAFGPEMFLCSGGVIRHGHVVELGGFPNIRITQDYWFYTEAIRQFGALFLERETAGYGVGDPGALWNPLDLGGAAKIAHTEEWKQELWLRSMKLRRAMGFPKFLALKIIFRVFNVGFERVAIPALDRLGFFEELYRLTDHPNGSARLAP